MPEIIEVEKQRQQLDTALTGRSLVYYESLYFRDNRPVLDHLLRKHTTADFDHNLLHTPIHGVDRIGKNLIIKTGSDRWTQIHLNSTGWFFPGNTLAATAAYADQLHKSFIKTAVAKNTVKHAMVGLTFDDGQVWYYVDPRTWGRFYPWQLANPAEGPPGDLRKYGMDWLREPALAIMKLGTWRKDSPRKVKQVLLDQFITAGIGNYMVCEILFRAALDPDEPWCNLSFDAKHTLGEIAADFIAYSLPKETYEHWYVFGKLNAPCPCCSTPIQRKLDTPNAIRASYYCPSCQAPLSGKTGRTHVFTNIPPRKTPEIATSPQLLYAKHGRPQHAVSEHHPELLPVLPAT